MKVWKFKLRLAFMRLLARVGLYLPSAVYYISGSDTLPPPLEREDEEMAITALEQGDDAAARREIIRRTHQRTLAAGDLRTYFVDGETLFGARGRFACTIDRCHPNDLGQMRMAETLCPVLARALEADGTPAALF